MDRRRQFWTLSLLSIFAVVGWAVVSARMGQVGFPLDDGWIHQTYARSLARGAGWSYFPGQPSAGATAPLWVLLLVPGYWLGASPTCWVLFLGVLLNWGLAVLVFQSWPYFSRHGGTWALAAGLVVSLEWHLLWAALSGMETLMMGVLVFGCLAALAALQSQGESDERHWHWIGTGALIGIGVWIRPEAVTLLGPALFVAVLKSAGRMRARAIRVGYVLLGVLAFFLPYLAFNRWLAGAWFPNTFFAKQAEYAVLREAGLLTRLINQPVPLLVGVGAVVLPGFLYKGVTVIRARNWAVLAGVLWLLGFVGLYAVRLPVTYQHGRYLMPAIPMLVVIGFAGAVDFIAVQKPGRLQWMLGRTWGALIGIILLLFWGIGVQAFSRDVAVINGEMVDMAGWLQSNTAPDDLIAAHDIGAIGYFTQRELLDLAGLISPDVIPFIRDEGRIAGYLNEQCPDYLVTFPSWYPELVEGLEPVYQTDAAVTREYGKDNMAVYRWPKCE